MFTRCLTCYGDLGSNREIAHFPIGARLAFDGAHGRLWVVCTRCGRWNLSPLEERWEAIDECERLFHRSLLQFSTDHIGLARRASGFELVRIGSAPRRELARWRYAPGLLRRHRAAGGRRQRIRAAAGALRAVLDRRLGARVGRLLELAGGQSRIVHVVPGRHGDFAEIRSRHIDTAELIRPDRGDRWRLVVHHELGRIELGSFAGLHVAGKLLGVLNRGGATPQQLWSAIHKLHDAADPESYFGRVSNLVLRTSWGRDPEAPRDAPVLPANVSSTERLALYLTSRTFWARGATGSDPQILLSRLPFEDRLALEMAVTEESERDALQGELSALEAAWREAEEVAAIADSMFDRRSSARAEEENPVLRRWSAWRRRLVPSVAPLPL